MGLPVGGGSPYWNIPYVVKYGVSIAKPIFVDGTVLVCGYGMARVPLNWPKTEMMQEFCGLRKGSQVNGSTSPS